MTDIGTTEDEVHGRTVCKMSVSPHINWLEAEIEEGEEEKLFKKKQRTNMIGSSSIHRGDD